MSFASSPPTRRRVAGALILAALCGLSNPADARAASDLQPLTVESSNGPHVFKVEVMADDAARQRGLMFRRYMPEDRGMLFDFKEVRAVSMWMKNTYLPLDMLFIARDGRVVSIAENAEPMSEELISSGGEILGVLEINAGLAARLGMKAGDRVRHPIFGK